MVLLHSPTSFHVEYPNLKCVLSSSSIIRISILEQINSNNEYLVVSQVLHMSPVLFYNIFRIRCPIYLHSFTYLWLYIPPTSPLLFPFHPRLLYSCHSCGVTLTVLSRLPVSRSDEKEQEKDESSERELNRDITTGWLLMYKRLLHFYSRLWIDLYHPPPFILNNSIHLSTQFDIHYRS